MTSTTKRHPARIAARPRLRRRRAGSPALDFEGEFDTGAYASWGPTVANRVPVHATGPYRVAACRAPAPAPSTPTGRSRAPFAASACRRRRSCRRRSIDRLADAAGIDRLEFRIAERACATATPRPPARCCSGVGIARLPRGAARRTGGARSPRRRRSTRRRGVRGAASASPPAGMAAAIPRCPTPRPSASALHRRRQARAASGRRSTSARARTPSSPRSPPTRSACRSPPSTLVGADTALTPDAGKTSASRQTFVSGTRRRGRRPRAARRRSCATPMPATTRALTLDGRRSGSSRSAARRRDRPRARCRPTPTAMSSPPRKPTTRRPRRSTPTARAAPYAVYGYGAQMAELAVDTGARHGAAAADHRRP